MNFNALMYLWAKLYFILSYITACNDCPSKACIHYKEECYFLIFGVNWFEARFECHQMQLNLLEITSADLIKYITKLGYKDGKFWTAFHREEWYKGTSTRDFVFYL